MWVMRSGVPGHPIVLYGYAPSRAGSVAEKLLLGFSGYLQTDDYAGYHAVGRKHDISHVVCWAHTRRKFIDAPKAATSKDKKTGRIGKADVAINYIAKLYAIEKQAKDTSSEARRQLRQEKSVPILKALREWLDKTLHSTLPKGLLGTTLGYLNKNWQKLIRYTEKSDVNIDNNLAENTIRPSL
jgi:transposase